VDIRAFPSTGRNGVTHGKCLEHKNEVQHQLIIV
jgi:hypothetical protein